jgi:hypothetical protein
MWNRCVPWADSTVHVDVVVVADADGGEIV